MNERQMVACPCVCASRVCVCVFARANTIDFISHFWVIITFCIFRSISFVRLLCDFCYLSTFVVVPTRLFSSFISFGARYFFFSLLVSVIDVDGVMVMTMMKLLIWWKPKTKNENKNENQTNDNNKNIIYYFNRCFRAHWICRWACYEIVVFI